MKQWVVFLILLTMISFAQASSVFHLESKKNHCQWKLYDVQTQKDRNYYKTEKCPNQIVWLKDKSFYFSIKSQIYWASTSTKKPIKIVNYQTARLGHSKKSEVIWGVKGKYNSIYTLVVDPEIKHIKKKGENFYQYGKNKISPESFRGVATEQKAAGVIRRWQKKNKKWKTVDYKLVGRYNPTGFDEDLYNNSVLSSKQIITYNECSDEQCSDLPSKSRWDISDWEKQLKLMDNGIESMGYLALNDNKGVLFKKALGETLHPTKPFLLCEDKCQKTTEIELPKSFSDNFAMSKKDNHLLVYNENRASVGSLYTFNSPKPIKSFKGPMVFWHPF